MVNIINIIIMIIIIIYKKIKTILKNTQYDTIEPVGKESNLRITDCLNFLPEH